MTVSVTNTFFIKPGHITSDADERDHLEWDTSLKIQSQSDLRAPFHVVFQVFLYVNSEIGTKLTEFEQMDIIVFCRDGAGFSKLCVIILWMYLNCKIFFCKFNISQSQTFQILFFKYKL